MSTADPDDAQLARTRFGAELRRLRKASGLTQAALANQAGYSRVYVTLVENGHDAPGEEFVGLVSGVLDARESFDRLFGEVVAAGRRSQEHTKNSVTDLFVANTLEVFDEPEQGIVVLQALGPDGEQIMVQLNRREALKKLGSAAATVSLSPSLARDLIAGHTTPSSATPIEHLRSMYRSLVDADNLFGSSHALHGTHEQVNLIERLYSSARGADRQDLAFLRAQFAESLAWLYQDQADHAAAWHWTDRALDWSHLAGETSLTCIVLARKSQLAGDAGDGAAAVDYAMALENLAPTASRLPAVAQACAAHGYALIGDRSASDQAYHIARDLVVSTEIDPGSNWGGWLDEAYIDSHQARSLSTLGVHTTAVETFDRALSEHPDAYPRDRGVYLARAARAHSRAENVEQAASLGQDALKANQTTKSGRIDAELRLLLDDFADVETGVVDEFKALAHAANLA